MTSRSADGGRRDYELTEAGRDRLEREADTVREIWQRAEDDESISESQGVATASVTRNNSNLDEPLTVQPFAKRV